MNAGYHPGRGCVLLLNYVLTPMFPFSTTTSSTPVGHIQGKHPAFCVLFLQPLNENVFKFMENFAQYQDMYCYKTRQYLNGSNDKESFCKLKVSRTGRFQVILHLAIKKKKKIQIIFIPALSLIQQCFCLAWFNLWATPVHAQVSLLASSGNHMGWQGLESDPLCARQTLCFSESDL